MARSQHCLPLCLLTLIATGCLNMGNQGAEGTLGVDTTGTDTPPATTSPLATTNPAPTPSGGGGVDPVAPTNPAVVTQPSGTGQSQNPNPATTPVVQEPVIVPVSGLNRFTWVGRFDLSNPNAIPLTFLGSKFGMRFTGTQLTIEMVSSNTDGLNIVLDGNAMPPLMVSKAAATRYQVVKDLPAGTHTVWLSKRTEFNQAGDTVLTLTGAYVDEGATFLTPPTPKKRRIEVIGDSGFAGYGVEGLFIYGDPNHPQCSYTPSNQNADLSVPGQLAKMVDAEVYNLSWSGRAIVASQYDKNPNHQLPVIYDQLIGNNMTKMYDFATMMDVVILSGGANDFIGTAGSGTVPDVDKFVQVYADWITRVRSHYPAALIIAAVGANAKQQDRANMINYLGAAVQKARSQPGGDANMIVFDYFANDPNGWTTYGDVAEKGRYHWGCNYHPSIEGSGWLAERLVPVVKQNRGW